MWTPSSTVVLVVALLLLAGWYLTFSASRLDRLHARLEGARAVLDAALVRRASVALQLAASDRLDPATRLLLADAAHQAREVDTEDQQAREMAESDLTRALHAVFEDTDVVADLSRDPVGRALLQELQVACHRAALARRLLNDVVRSVRVVRRKRAVRYLRLAGHAPWPETFEINDTPPPALLSSGA